MTAKPGYRTTEFWVTTITSVAALVAALTSNLNPRYAALGAAVSEGLYAISRGITKHGAALATRPAPAASAAPVVQAVPTVGP